MRNLFQTIVHLWGQYRESPKFVRGVDYAILMVSPEDSAKFYRLNVKIATMALRMSNYKELSEELFYRKVLRINVDMYLKEILDTYVEPETTALTIGSFFKKELHQQAELKPFLLRTISERIAKVPDEKLGKVMMQIMKSKPKQLSAYTEIAKLFEKDTAQKAA